MKALDSLKMDIDDYEEVLGDNILTIQQKIKRLNNNFEYLKFYELYEQIEELYVNIVNLQRDKDVLDKMRTYYKLFEEEQKKEDNDHLCKTKKQH